MFLVFLQKFPQTVLLLSRNAGMDRHRKHKENFATAKHNLREMSTNGEKMCKEIRKRLRLFLRKKKHIIWFVSIYLVILQPKRNKTDFQDTNHNYIKTQTAETFKNLKSLDEMSGLFDLCDNYTIMTKLTI